jgi:hypothetical protein
MYPRLLVPQLLMNSQKKYGGVELMEETKEQRHGGMREARPVLKSGTYNEYLGKKVKCTDTPLFLEAVNTNRRNICHVTSLGCGILQILNKC